MAFFQPSHFLRHIGIEVIRYNVTAEDHFAADVISVGLVRRVLERDATAETGTQGGRQAAAQSVEDWDNDPAAGSRDLKRSACQ